MKGSVTSKHSKQREAIIQVLHGTTSHPNADWVYDKVREIIPNISLGTVYRNLSKLADSNMALRLDVGDGNVHFDATVEPHYHLYCEECGCVMDLKMPYLSTLNTEAENTEDIKISSHALIFKGLCKGCNSQKD